MIEQETSKTLLNLIVLNQLQLEYLDMLKGTPYYKGKIKVFTKPLNIQLEKSLVRELTVVYENDEEIVVNALRSIDGVLKRLSTLAVDDILVYDQILEHYNADKDGFLLRNNIKLKQLEK